MLRVGSRSATCTLSRAGAAHTASAVSHRNVVALTQPTVSRCYSAHRPQKGPRLAPQTSRIPQPQRARRTPQTPAKADPVTEPSPSESSATQASEADHAENKAVVPVHPSVHTTAVVPNEPRDVLQPADFEGAAKLLSQSALIVTRELEMLNIFLGYEEANHYALHTPSGELVGYLAETQQGMLGGALKRQLMKTRRPFRATVMDVNGKPVLSMRRPFTWINSRCYMYAVRSSHAAGEPQESDLDLIGEVQQSWHLYRRRYELFLRRTNEQDEDTFEQFAQINARFWAWTFAIQDAQERLVGMIDRNFRGFGREIFTDTGQYVLNFDSAGAAATEPRLTDSTQTQDQAANKDDGAASGAIQSMELVQSHGTRPLTLDERAVALATAVSIDFDYFSRLSEGSGASSMFPWFYMGGMGGGGGEGGAEAPPPTTTGPDNESSPSSDNDAGVDSGTIGSGMDYPYGASDSGSSDDGWSGGQPPSQADNSPPLSSDGEVWGEGSADPWAGAGNTTPDEAGMFSGWGDSDGDSDGGGGGLWGTIGGFFGNDD